VARLQLSVLVIVVLLAGCGGDSGSSASEDYANSVCGDLSAWVTEVNGAITSLTDAGLATDRDDVQSSVDQATEATDDLLGSLEELGPPETDDGQQAKSELDSLGATLRQQIETVEQALDADTGAAALATTVTAALSTAASAVESTYNDLKGLDPGGELEDAFKNADDCKSLQEQVDEIGS
jgi:methyl-accepting chemotaxis protein